jgi:hypothetical protein
MNETTRSHFWKILLAGAACALILPALGAGFDDQRGDRVGWARLKTPSPWWMRHANGDPALMRFLRDNSSLNIDPNWYVAEVEKLDEMCQYPLLFSQGIHVLQDPAARGNVVEYIRRGGFLLVDACCNVAATPDHDVFLAQHKKLLAEILPEARVVLLPPDHLIYRCYFQIPGGKPPHTFYGHVYNAYKAKNGLYGIMIGRRMAGLISLSGLQCGWSPLGDIPPPAGHDVACMKMLTNIYVYAMLQGD